ncbi:PACRG-like protein [Dendronephthya gigantea]|uniref:PACRG-like protein n=1 Tax=Dendronephthya gigantea TaxID=151771 RepID=UPI00106B2AFB|nr:PACRG-like protein [Dendronephthya gigantea]
MATRGSNNFSTSSSKRVRSPQVSVIGNSPCRPSDRLNPKTIDPFKSDSGKQSTFAAIYNNGGVPCRLQHGSVKHKIQWDAPIEELSFDPLLVTMAEGLQETKHPYNFLARQGFRELLDLSDAGVKTLPLLPKLVQPLRVALSSQNAEVFFNTLDALVQLSSVVGKELNPHLKSLMAMISRKIMEKNNKEKITHALQEMENHCGHACTAVIKAKVPTYQSVLK